MVHLQYPINFQPACQVPGCKNGVQLQSMNGNQATWMKTCCRHTYEDLPEEQERIETFWPPSQ
jgi:hypothetical protein